MVMMTQDSFLHQFYFTLDKYPFLLVLILSGGLNHFFPLFLKCWDVKRISCRCMRFFSDHPSNSSGWISANQQSVFDWKTFNMVQKVNRDAVNCTEYKCLLHRRGWRLVHFCSISNSKTKCFFLSGLQTLSKPSPVSKLPCGNYQSLT